MSEVNKRKSSVGARVEEGKSNMWQEILREAMTKKDIDDSNIFVFGDKSCGKKTLFRMLSKEVLGEEETKKVLAIDENSTKFGQVNYSYLNLRRLNDDDSESLGKIGLWFFNDLIDKDTFISLIKPQYIEKSLIIIMVDLSRPWLIKTSIDRWTNLIYDAFGALIVKLPKDKQDEMRKNGKEFTILYNFIFNYSCQIIQDV